MKRSLQLLFGVCLCLMLLAGDAISGQGLQSIRGFGSGGGGGGNPATILDEDGLVTVLEPHEGKVLVINFFATWCPPCKEEIPGLIAVRNKFPESKLYIVGLSLDEDVNALKKMIRDMGINYPVYRAGSDVRQLFDVTSIPHNVVFDTEVDLVANESGFVSEQELTNFINKYLR